MNNLAIIPARGGSKRIPKKNIKDFLGKPIISYSIRTAINSGLFDEIMVSTDDIEIAEIAKKYDAEVPFFRSKEKSNDYFGLADVVIEVLEQYKEYGKEFDNVCCILATAPFINREMLVQSFKKLCENNFDSVFSVVKYSFPIQRAMQFNPENMTKRSQDLTTSFHDAGLFYWIKSEVLLTKKKLWTENTGAIIISEQETQDIDTIEDWEIAEIKYQIINGK
jgi:N-acylneuraminate cytidylyltransferase